MPFTTGPEATSGGTQCRSPESSLEPHLSTMPVVEPSLGLSCHHSLWHTGTCLVCHTVSSVVQIPKGVGKHRTPRCFCGRETLSCLDTQYRRTNDNYRLVTVINCKDGRVPPLPPAPPHTCLWEGDELTQTAHETFDSRPVRRPQGNIRS